MSCFVCCQRKYLYFLFFCIGSWINLIIFISLIIYYYISKNEYVWYSSKILSIEKLLKDNYANYKLYNAFLSYGYYNALNFSYYELLKNSNRDKCPENLKQCGILDTYGNKLCLSKNIDCPVNEIIIDSSEKIGNYKSKGYKVVNYRLTRFYNDCYLYYTNTKTDNNITNSFIYYSYDPKLIDSHNFIFDKDAYEKKFEYKANNPYVNANNITSNNMTNNITNEKENKGNDNSVILNLTQQIEGKENEIDFWYDVSETKSKLSSSPNLIKYIGSRINNTAKDENYIKIYDKLYIKNFVGFGSAEEMDILFNSDFINYKDLFPHDSKLFLLIFFSFLLIFFLIFYSKKIYDDENDGDDNTCKQIENFIIICEMACYTFSFVYFFLYLIKSCHQLYNIKNLSELKNIKCDKLIKDFIYEYIGKINKKRIFVIIFIILISISLVFYILSIFFYALLKIKKENAIQLNNEMENNKIAIRNNKNSNEEKDDNNIISNEKENDNSKNIQFENNGSKRSEREKLTNNRRRNIKNNKKKTDINIDKKPLCLIS